MDNSVEYQRAVSEMVGDHVLCCLSGFVYALSQEAPDSELMLELHRPDETEDTLRECLEEGADAGVEERDGEWWWRTDPSDDDADDPDLWEGPFDTELEALREACFQYNLDPEEYAGEIMEHWAVTDWLGRQLRGRNETVRDVGGLDVWCRQATGQAIKLDGVICAIYDECCAPPSPE